MKKRINLRLILIAGIAVIVTMICMTGIYYKLFQGQVRKDLQINARLLSDTGLFDDSDNTNVSLSEYYEVGEDLRVTWIAKDGTVLFDNDLDISQLPNHKNRPEVKYYMPTTLTMFTHMMSKVVSLSILTKKLSDMNCNAFTKDNPSL